MAITGGVHPIAVQDQRVVVSQPASNTGTTPRSKEIPVAVAVAILGAAVVMFGAVVVLARVKFASVLFGARTFLGVPLTDMDAGKVVFVALGGTALAAIGVITVVGGVAVAILATVRAQR